MSTSTSSNASTGTSTAVGPDALNLVEAVPAVEALLSTLLVSD